MEEIKLIGRVTFWTRLNLCTVSCIEKIVKCLERFNKSEIDADTSSKIEKQILVDEFDDPEFLEFAIEL